MKTDVFLWIRLNYMAECADLITARAVALRMALIEGDLIAADAIFEAIRAIARSYVSTRKELQTVSNNDARECSE